MNISEEIVFFHSGGPDWGEGAARKDKNKWHRNYQTSWYKLCWSWTITFPSSVSWLHHAISSFLWLKLHNLSDTVLKPVSKSRYSWIRVHMQNWAITRMQFLFPGCLCYWCREPLSLLWHLTQHLNHRTECIRQESAPNSTAFVLGELSVLS